MAHTIQLIKFLQLADLRVVLANTHHLPAGSEESFVHHRRYATKKPVKRTVRSYRKDTSSKFQISAPISTNHVSYTAVVLEIMKCIEIDSTIRIRETVVAHKPQRDTQPFAHPIRAQS